LTQLRKKATPRKNDENEGKADPKGDSSDEMDEIRNIDDDVPKLIIIKFNGNVVRKVDLTK
jgi:hypothetical protein